MEDEEIVTLYFERSESAIVESDIKYGKYCRYIAYQILNSDEDADECVNDTWLNAWNAIPPAKPRTLKGFLGAITRNLAINRMDYNCAEKRNNNLVDAIDEYFTCFPANSSTIADEVALKRIINEFLESLDKRTRVIFMRRYWYTLSVKEIADGLHMSENHINVILHRTRKKFKEHLEKEEVIV